MPLVNAGRDAVAGLIVGSGAAYNGTNARLGAGNSAAATTSGMTDLQGASKTRKLVDSAPGVAANVLTFVATFGTADGNHDWFEQGVFRAASADAMLARNNQNMGTKTSLMTVVWTHTVTVAIGT